ncbi:MAG: hypothetical protein ACMUJM_24620 [bacterium]
MSVLLTMHTTADTAEIQPIKTISSKYAQTNRFFACKDTPIIGTANTAQIVKYLPRHGSYGPA